MQMTCDNDCTRAGWQEYILVSDSHELHVSTAPDADLDGEFLAFCHDTQEMIKVNGWLFSIEDIED